jgi:hypothetical protein
LSRTESAYDFRHAGIGARLLNGGLHLRDRHGHDNGDNGDGDHDFDHREAARSVTDCSYL